MKIRKKTWPEFFEKIASGEKKFEVRLADFECQPGDVLALEEWSPKTKSYTGRKIEKRITYVFKTKDQEFYSPEDAVKYGWQIISFE